MNSNEMNESAIMITFEQFKNKIKRNNMKFNCDVYFGVAKT